MRIAIDAVGIRGHGGAAVLLEILYWLPKLKPEWLWHVFLLERGLREFDDPVIDRNMVIECTNSGNSGLARLSWVNNGLRARLEDLHSDVLFSFANIAPRYQLIPQVVLVHQSNAFFDEGIPKRAITKRIRLRIMRRQILLGAAASQGVIVQTEAMRERIERFRPDLKGRIHVIPSGYHTPLALSAVRAEKKLIIDDCAHPRLIYVTHPSEHKNHTRLIEALPNIVKVFPQARLLLTLDRKHVPNKRYSGFVQDIEKTANDLGVASNVVWLGILTPEEVDYALRTSDLMVFPSLAESFGLGLVESLAAGCPLVASDLPYAHDVASDAAAYFDPLQPESIAKVVLSTLSNESLLAQMKEKCAARKINYSYESIARRLASLLEECKKVTR